MKSGNLNFLEPSGALQACNGTALYSNNVEKIVYIQEECEVQQNDQVSLFELLLTL